MNWKKAIKRLSVAIVILLAVFVIAASLLLRSRSFHRYLLAKMDQKAERATGSRVTIGDFRFRWSGLRADLYRLTLDGVEKNPAQPLFTADHVAVGLKIISVLGHKVRLNYVTLDHPVVHLTVDEQGKTNIPAPRNSKEPSQPVNVFNLAVGRVQINHGEVYYQDVRLPLDASCRHLQTQLAFDGLKTTYRGTISYKEGIVRFAHFNPLQHHLETTFSAAPSGLTVDHLVVVSGASRISAQAHLTDYSNPSIRGTYRMNISDRQLQDILKNPQLPIGEMIVGGSLHYQRAPGQPFLRSLALDGQLNSSRLDVSIPQAHSALRELRARYQLEQGNLRIRGLEAELLGGNVRADMTIENLANSPDFRMLGSFHDVSLTAVNAALSSKPLKDVPLQGRADGQLLATWHGHINRAKIHSDITIRANTATSATTPDQAAAMKIPVNGVFHVSYDASRNVLSLTQSYLRTPHLNVQVNGTLGGKSRLNVNASTDDLHEVDVLALGMRRTGAPHSGASPPPLLGLKGSASFAGQVLGSVKDPRFTGQIAARNLQFREERVRVARSYIVLACSQLKLSQGDLETTGNGSIRFNVAAGLRDWSYSAASPARIQAEVNRMPLEDLERLAHLQYPVTGLVNAQVAVHGSPSSPAGQGSVQITKARFFNQPVESFSVRFQGGGNTIHSTLRILTPAGSASANLNYDPHTEGYEGQLEASNLRLSQLAAVRSRGLGLSGSLTVAAQGSGTFRSPQLDASVQIPMLQFRQQRIGAIKAHLHLAKQRASVTLDCEQGDLSVKATGDVDLKVDYDVTAKLEARGTAPGVLLARYLPGEAGNLRIQTEIHAALHGPLKYPGRIVAQVEVPTLKAGYQSIQLANRATLRADYRNATLTLQPAELKGSGTDLRLQGTVPMRGPGSMNASVSGTVNLAVIQLLYPEWDSSGQLALNIHAQGSRSHPKLGADVRILNAAFQAPDAPVGIEKLNGEFAVENNRVEIRQFAGTMGGGEVSAQGSVIYSPNLQFNVQLEGKRVRLRYPHGVRTVLDSHLSLVGTTEASTLSGQVLIDRMSFTPTFDFGTFINQFNEETETPPNQGLTQNMKLNVAIQSTEELGLVSSTLSLQASANLKVRGTVAEPIILGRATVSGGEVSFLHRTYQIQSGSINFVNPVRTEPVVNVLVTTVVNQYNLSLNFAGPIDHLRTTYTSDPPLPPVDVINLLVRGETTEEASAQPSAPGVLGAESVLAEGLAGQVSGQITKFTGISSLTIDPLIGGNQQNPGARLAIQKHVTKNLSFTFSTDVTTTQGQIIQVQYQLSPRWSVSVVRDQYGAVGVDVRMHKSF